MDKTFDSPIFNHHDILTISEILRYLLMGTGYNIDTIVNYQITLKKITSIGKITSSTLETIRLTTLIYYHIPNLLDLGEITLKLQDYKSLLNIYLNEVRARLSTEETSEKVTKVINPEEYDEYFGV